MERGKREIKRGRRKEKKGGKRKGARKVRGWEQEMKERKRE